jgi:dolichol kinase
LLTGVAVMLAAYASVLAAAEFLRRRGWPGVLTRKFAHAAGGVISCALPVLVTKAAAISIGVGLSASLWLAARRGALGSINDCGRRTAGAVLFPAGLALSAFLFWRSDAVVFQWSALLLGFADGAAGAAGDLWGTRGYSVTGHKTVEGSLTFLAASLAVLAAFVYVRRGALLPADAAVVIVGALALTAVESALGRGWDNVGVPLAGGMVLQILR